MKIKMIAIAPYDGWAFIVKDERLYLVRPPYQSHDLIESSEKDLAAAISKYQFQESNSVFKTLTEAINFLKDKYVESMEKSGFKLPKQEELKSLLEYATDDILLEYLDMAEKELIPNRNLDAAESLALELMQLEKVKANGAMFNRAVKIIKKCQEERNRLNPLTVKFFKFPQKYPNARKRYTEKSIIELMNDIYHTRQLLPVGI
jgi:hypothetical protein